jgi:tetratricopeptide (TPR) repeat protein
MRNLLAALIVLVAVGLAALLFRLQPSDTVTVFRDGERITARTTRVYLRFPGSSGCRVKTLGDRLAFEADEPATLENGDEFSAHVRFTYTAPSLVPARWPPSGDWCASLTERVSGAVARGATKSSTADLLDRRRRASDAIAGEIDKELRDDGILASGVSARVDLPTGFERLRPIQEVADRVRSAPPVIFIGLDGADWQLLDLYMASGAMPNLQRLASTGTRGPLETEIPPLSPLVWTTMMTGASPLQHQILDFTRFNPYTYEKEPITSDERRVPAIWNMLTYGGKSAAVFGLWATYAAEPVHAVNVSDRLFTFLYSTNERPASVVYPPQRQKWAEQHVTDAEHAVDLTRMREYLPSLTEEEFAALSKTQNPYADTAAALRRILIETEVYRHLSLDYLRGRTRIPDLTIVYFQGTDSIGHEFAPFAPPKQPNIAQADYDRYKDVPEKYFRYIDAILGDYITLAQKAGAVIVIASDHGFRWSEGRPAEVSSTATATAAKWHRNEGIFVLWGAGTVEKPKGIREICRVLLNLTGMPELDYSRYFQPAISPPPPAAGHTSTEEIAKLRALGYIGANESTRSAVPQSDTKTAGAFNNAGLILRNEHRLDEAIAAFERALAVEPRYASAMWNLSETLFDANRDFDRSDTLLISALRNGLADGSRFVIVRSIAYQRSSRGDRSLHLLEQAVAAAPDDGQLRMFRGRYRMERHDCPGALEDFLSAQNQQPGNALPFASAGLAQLCLGDNSAADASFARARQIDPRMPLPR